MSGKRSYFDRASDYYKRTVSLKYDLLANVKALIKLSCIPEDIGDSIVAKIDKEEILSLSEARDINSVLKEYQKKIKNWNYYWRIYEKHYPANTEKIEEQDEYIFKNCLPEYAKKEIDQECEDVRKFAEFRKQMERERIARKINESHKAQINDRPQINNHNTININETKKNNKIEIKKIALVCCKYCGRSFDRVDDNTVKFCMFCGKNLGEMNCPSCGKLISDLNSKFCQFCGCNLKKNVFVDNQECASNQNNRHIDSDTSEMGIKLRKYKLLLDEGLITEEDYQKVKNQILGI